MDTEKQDIFPDKRDLLAIYKLDYETTAALVGNLAGSYSKILVTSLLLIGALFTSGILFDSEADSKTDVIFLVLPYIVMLVLTIENYARSNLWFNYIYLMILQERINKFIGDDIFWFSIKFRPMMAFRKKGIWLVNAYRSLLPFIFYFGTVIYSLKSVKTNIDEITKSKLLIEYYFPVTLTIFIITTCLWLYFHLTMFARYEKDMRKEHWQKSFNERSEGG